MKAAATGLAILVTVAAAGRARAENPTMKEAGAKSCSVGRPILLQKLPPDDNFKLETELAMTASGGLAIMAADGGLIAQPLAADGSKRGAARPFEWPAPYDPQSLTAVGGRFLALGPSCSNLRLNCISARWIDHDGASGERREIDVGDRSLDLFPRAVGDRVRVLATRREDKPGTDLWLDIGRDDTGHVDVVMREIDILGQYPGVWFQDEPDGPWLIAVWLTGNMGEGLAQTRYVNADGRGGPIAGWPAAGQLVATAPGRRVLVWPDNEHHTEWVDYRLELDGTLTEQRRAPTARALPPPFVNRVGALTTGRNGVSLRRGFTYGDWPPPTLITGHLRPVPGDVVWSAGRFFVVYAERNKDAVLVKLRAATCK